MTTEVTLPRLGEGMESAEITAWLKAEGDAVAVGEPLYEVETDKAIQEVAAEVAGTLLKILVAEGEVEIGTTLALIGDPAAEQAVAPTPAAPAPAGVGDGEPEPEPERSQPNSEDGFELIELSGVRRTIARRLSAAWEIPVFGLGIHVRAEPLVQARERLRATIGSGAPAPTVNDVLVKLVALALEETPALNARLTDAGIERHRAANVGIAVAAERGLVVPVVRDVGGRSVGEVAAARARLVEKARENRLAPADLEAGTFTVSNLGMYGIDEFVAVLNPPQVAILAAGAIAERPFALDGELALAPTLHLFLTCDHRAVDGADGAGFLTRLRELIESPPADLA